MGGFKKVLWLLVFAMFLGFAYIFSSILKREPNDNVKLITLRNAMALTVAGNIEDEVGYGPRAKTATELANVLARRFQSADSLSEEDEKEVRSMGAPIVKIKYVVGPPTEPFQISLEPDDDTGVVTIRSWGRDLENPIEEQEVHVENY